MLYKHVIVISMAVMLTCTDIDPFLSTHLPQDLSVLVINFVQIQAYLYQIDFLERTVTLFI